MVWGDVSLLYGFTTAVDPARVASAREFLGGEEIVIEPRKRWPIGLFPDLPKTTIPSEHQYEPGRALCRYNVSPRGSACSSSPPCRRPPVPGS